jgi:hypothetical protein
MGPGEAVAFCRAFARTSSRLVDAIGHQRKSGGGDDQRRKFCGRTLSALKERADNRDHSGQLYWQHAQGHFCDCHPENDTPKHLSGSFYYNNILKRTIKNA